MGVYIHFTEEQKLRANNVDLVDFLQKRSEKLLPSGREKRIASDRSITIHGNEWYDHSLEYGGYAIDFVQQFYHLSYPEAVTMLLSGEQGEVYRSAEETQVEPKKPFALPAAHSDMRRVYAYLVKTRLLDHVVVSTFIKEKLLYESCEKSKDGKKEYHNAIFVGFDEHGIPRHAHKRGLYTKGAGFKGNVDGSDPAYNFHYIGTGNALYVFEAPIDLLSYITLRPQDWEKHSYVALCGLSEYAMTRLLELHPNINRVVLCLDHDAEGIEASEKYFDMLTGWGILCEQELSAQKDWNEDIKAAHGFPAIPAEEHPQRLLCEVICAGLGEGMQDSQADCSPDAFSALLATTRAHLHGGRFLQAEDCLWDMLCRAVNTAAKEYRQMDHSRDHATVQARLQYGFKTYENRRKIKARLDLLEADIIALRSFDRVLTSGEKDDLAERFESIAAHCLKSVILIEQHLQKQEQKQEMKLSMQ
ncbi:DUF3991 and toprim domain-containing protein [Sinanaerobacter chloroacetimidivorans]|uniref:DUF3991 and TOPRIM domain-containing protein n=1 Tax=Sinanaerobacter chloroacetimidivorans TaxID=2818044 RepID=A0A8J7W119_9FIRM|nr:DUF3991 and toprim domain-containing protein [Sinanaerobacter chloroacetimidivorans]MBR0598446.1 DUF3991 and TOPRIM domain-containing protein [Sinanaerobacter chloroacetimidivorans]